MSQSVTEEEMKKVFREIMNFYLTVNETERGYNINKEDAIEKLIEWLQSHTLTEEDNINK